MEDDNKYIDNENIISELLSEFKGHRNSLLKMIEEIEILKENINQLFPENLDKRYLMYFQEKVKAMTGVYNSLLDIRKEISKSLKDEIDLRRKTISKENDDNIEDFMDIKSIADKIKNFNKEKDSCEKNINQLLKKNKKEPLKIVE